MKDILIKFKMPRGCSLSDLEKGKILSFKEQGLKFREIARKLSRSVNVIRNFLGDPDNYGTKKRSGRKKILSHREIAHISRLASHSTLSLRDIKNQTAVTASKVTIWRAIKSNKNIKYSKMSKIPRLLPRHICARLQLARENMQTNWMQVRLKYIGLINLTLIII